MPSPNDDPFSQLCRVKEEYVDATWRWYRDHSTWPRIVFRLVGVTVIVLSLGIPFLAAAGGGFQTLGVPIASLLIAITSALNAFFAWQKTWEKRITTQLTLEGLIAVWRTEMDAARRDPDGDKGYDEAKKATQRLVEKTRTLTVAETANWFTNFSFPEDVGGNQPGKQSRPQGQGQGQADQRHP